MGFASIVCVFKADLHVVTQIGAMCRATLATPAAAKIAEHLVKDI